MVVIVVFTVTNQLQTVSYKCKNRDPPLMDGWDDLDSKNRGISYMQCV